MVRTTQPLLLPQELLDSAADWVDREGELDASEELELAEWLAADERHVEAYRQVKAGWDAPALTGAMHTLSAPGRTRRGVAIGIGLAACVAAAFAFLASPISPLAPTAQPERYATNIGSRAEHALSDGSTIALNAATELTFTAEDGLRRTHLLRGQAYFDVASDADRPFVVDADDVSVTVIGTRFDINQTSSAVIISVIEGRVRVVLADGQAHELGAEQALKIADGRVHEVVWVGSDAILAWRSGWLIIQDAALTDVAAQMERYLGKPVRVASAAGTAPRVSGRFHLDQPRQALSLAAELNDHVVEESAEQIEVKPQP